MNKHYSLMKTGYIISGAGGVLFLIGNIIQIDSHKYIGRASIYLGANNVGVKVNF